MQLNAILLLCTVAPVTAVLRGAGDQTLMTNMQPEVVRKLLDNVEQKWIHTRAMVISNVTDDGDAFADMEKSCVKVSRAIIAGSEGQKDRVTEYMQDVCDVYVEGSHDGKGLCSSFASGIESVMTDDSEFNRDELKMSQFCRKYWDNAIASAAQEEAKEKQREQADEEAKEKMEKEAEEKQKAEEEAAKAKEVADQAAMMKAHQAAAEPQTNETSLAAQPEATATPVETPQANSTDANVRVISSSTVISPVAAVATTNDTSTAVAAPEAPVATTTNDTAAVAEPAEKTVVVTNTSATNATSAAAVVQTPEKKTSSTSVAKIADKNATVATKK